MAPRYSLIIYKIVTKTYELQVRNTCSAKKIGEMENLK